VLSVFREEGHARGGASFDQADIHAGLDLSRAFYRKRIGRIGGHNSPGEVLDGGLIRSAIAAFSIRRAQAQRRDRGVCREESLASHFPRDARKRVGRPLHVDDTPQDIRTETDFRKPAVARRERLTHDEAPGRRVGTAPRRVRGIRRIQNVERLGRRTVRLGHEVRRDFGGEP